jgi:hypothetical protein
VRVALTSFRWPLDPALAQGRDETTLARTLYATPLRTDAASGAVVPGLCSAWKASPDFREWRFTCRAAPSVAAALRRLVRLRDAPAHWLFAAAEHITARGSSTVVVRLRFAWRRFPYALTVVGAAPRFVPGPFRLVSGSSRRVVVRRPGLTVAFSRLGVRTAVKEFRRGSLDEAPIPVGDVGALRAELPNAVRARTLLGLDLLIFHRLGRELRRAYWETAERGDYEELVNEARGSSAFGLIGKDEKAHPGRRRSVENAIRTGTLPRVRVQIDVPVDPVLRYGAGLLYAQWRDDGLGPQLVTHPERPANASFLRLLSAYPQEEALLGELVLRDGVGPRARLVRALGATHQHEQLEALDAEFRASAVVVPVGWVVDTRLVSPRLEGWREDALGNVDYDVVRPLASSRRP